MQAHQISSLRRVMLLMAVATFAVIAMAACGGDDSDTRAAGPSPTQTPIDPTATATPAEPTATPMPEPPAAPMTPATAPEPGSDEAQIMAVLEKQVLAVNTADYVAFQETCTPSAKKLPTIAQLKYIYEENEGSTEAFAVSLRFSPQGYNVRNVEVKLLRAPFAQATFYVYDDEKQLGTEGGFDWTAMGQETVTQTYEKVDGQWYSEFVPCDWVSRRR